MSFPQPCQNCNKSMTDATLCATSLGITPEQIRQMGDPQQICDVSNAMLAAKKQPRTQTGFFQNAGASMDEGLGDAQKYAAKQTQAAKECVGETCDRAVKYTDQAIPGLETSTAKGNFGLFAGIAYFLIITILVITMLFAFAAVARMGCCCDAESGEKGRKIMITVWTLSLSVLVILFVMMIYFRRAGMSRMMPIIIGMIGMATATGLGIWGWRLVVNVLDDDEQCTKGYNPYHTARIVAVVIGLLAVVTMLVLVFTLTQMGCTASDGFQISAMIKQALLAG